jgi:CPA1 family monovalent cation:H+ antiporter
VNPWWLAAYALALTSGLVLLRLVWVWTSLRLTLFRAGRRGEAVTKPHWRLVMAMSVAGVRGAITLAGVSTLPLLLPDGSPFPARELAIFLATSVILLSLLLASVALPRLLKGMHFPEESVEEREEALARRDAALAAVGAIERAQLELLHHAEDADIYANAASRVIALYQRRLDRDGSSSGAQQVRQADEAEKALRMAGLQAERKTIFRLARLGRISDQTSRKLVREIDLLESRYR